MVGCTIGFVCMSIMHIRRFVWMLKFHWSSFFCHTLSSLYRLSSPGYALFTFSDFCSKSLFVDVWQRVTGQYHCLVFLNLACFSFLFHFVLSYNNAGEAQNTLTIKRIIVFTASEHKFTIDLTKIFLNFAFI